MVYFKCFCLLDTIEINGEIDLELNIRVSVETRLQKHVHISQRLKKSMKPLSTAPLSPLCEDTQSKVHIGQLNIIDITNTCNNYILKGKTKLLKNLLVARYKYYIF